MSPLADEKSVVVCVEGGSKIQLFLFDISQAEPNHFTNDALPFA